MAERDNERDDRDRPWRDAGEYSGRGEYYRTRGREGERGTWRREHDREDDRGLMERAGDEVRSWFGDDEAARRREIDDRREARDRDRGWNRDDPGWRNVPERERYRISDDWDQRERSARVSGASAYGTGSSDWRGRGPHRGEWRGPHAGKGPRGYQRSDDRITEDICDLLTRDPNLDASGIEVSVKQAEVTLRGTVESRYDKRATEDLAESVPGVRQVHNELRVGDGQMMAGAPGIESSPTRGDGQSGRGLGDETDRRRSGRRR